MPAYDLFSRLLEGIQDLHQLADLNRLDWRPKPKAMAGNQGYIQELVRH